MSEEGKLEFLDRMIRNGANIGQIVMDNHGTMNLTNNMGKDGDKSHQDTPPEARDSIMEYVGRLKPLVRREFIERYDQIWEGILEIGQVKAVIYNKGKQQDTTFNRNLLAQIIHQVEMIYLPTANNAQKTIYLEPEKGADHPVRQKLGEAPEKAIKKAVEEYLRNYLG